MATVSATNINGKERYLNLGIVRKCLIQPEKRGGLLMATGKSSSKGKEAGLGRVMDKTAITVAFELQTWGMFGLLTTCPFPKSLHFS